MKIIVFDDDPTGSQTVHDCLLLLKWDYQTLLKGIRSPSKLLFILCNTRSLNEEEVLNRLNEICITLIQVINNEGYLLKDFVFVSRGDSTLRGHNFLEPSVINKNLGPFDATFHIPAFIEGGRFTINGCHFIKDTPVNETIFAKDKIFGYQTNNIKELLHKKSKSKVKLNEIENLNLSDLEMLQFEENNKIFVKVRNFKNNVQVIVDAKNYLDLDKFCHLVYKLKSDKKFLFRTAASFISAFSKLGFNKKNNIYYSSLRRKDSNSKYMQGLIVVGSHVDISTLQLMNLLKLSFCQPIEINVNRFYSFLKSSDKESLIKDFKNQLVDHIKDLIKNKYTPVLFTSRKVISFQDKYEEFSFNEALAIFMAQIVRELKHEIGYLVSKGGITTNTILSEGFNIASAYLEGQIMTGISLLSVNLQEINTCIPFITFPGNIGEPDTLQKIILILETKEF